ncbi:GlcG/HbpS family heme-binding protein [Longispora albida]|uniref:GlcG/HbpS family heme-binding protein n=1 Tax=Longispora albida TaxID=203523 RepID=UPI00035C2E5A|nr:heme-binding protein [Longispora albida]
MTKMNRRMAIVGAAAGLAVVAGSAGVALAADDRPATAPGQARHAVSQPAQVITIDSAIKAAQATLDAAEKGGHKVTVVVMDRSGVVRVTLHGDGAGPQTDESAKRKAFTAVSFGQPTSALAARAGGTNPSVRDIPGTLFLGGGVPITVDGAPIAAIGVGGAPSGDLDEQYAQAGLAVLR